MDNRNPLPHVLPDTRLAHAPEHGCGISHVDNSQIYIADSAREFCKDAVVKFSSQRGTARTHSHRTFNSMRKTSASERPLRRPILVSSASSLDFVTGILHESDHLPKLGCTKQASADLMLPRPVPVLVSSVLRHPCSIHSTCERAQTHAQSDVRMTYRGLGWDTCGSFCIHADLPSYVRAPFCIAAR